jgi:hypothetical protein
MAVTPEADTRTAERRARDEQIANEPPLPHPELPPGTVLRPMESFLDRRPIAIAGVVENGLVRPMDPTVTLREHSRVIIVASERP